MSLPRQSAKLAGVAHDKKHAMCQNAQAAVIGIDIGKNSFHNVGHDKHGATPEVVGPAGGGPAYQPAAVPDPVWRLALARIREAALQQKSAERFMSYIIGSFIFVIGVAMVFFGLSKDWDRPLFFRCGLRNSSLPRFSSRSNIS